MSGLFREKEAKPRVVKTGIDAADSRRRRQDQANGVRKNTRESMLDRVRRVPAPAALPDSGRTELLSPVEQAEKIARLPSDAATLMAAPDAESVTAALVNLRALLTLSKTVPLPQVVAAGLVPALVHVTTIADMPNAILIEALWCLTNIGAGAPEFTAAVYEANAIQAILPLLNSTDAEVREQAVWAIGNIAGDNATYRDTILSYGTLPKLCDLAHGRCKVSMLRNITWVLSNLCRGRPGPAWEHVSPALPTLVCMLNYADDEVIADAAWALTGLTDAQAYDSPEEVDMRLEHVSGSGIIPRLVLLLTHPDPHVKTAALRTVGNLSSGSDVITDALMGNNVVTALAALVNANRRQLRKEACWVLSNITAGTVEQVVAVVEARVFARIIELMQARDADVRKEATWCVTNAIAAKIEAVTGYVAGLGCLARFAQVLLDEGVDVKQTRAVLEAVETVLEYGEEEAAAAAAAAGAGEAAGAYNKYALVAEQVSLVETVAQLQHSHDAETARLAGEIIGRFFNGAEDDEMVGAAAAGEDGSFAGAGAAGAATNFDF